MFNFFSYVTFFFLFLTVLLLTLALFLKSLIFFRSQLIRLITKKSSEKIKVSSSAHPDPVQLVPLDEVKE